MLTMGRRSEAAAATIFGDVRKRIPAEKIDVSQEFIRSDYSVIYEGFEEKNKSFFLKRGNVILDILRGLTYNNCVAGVVL